MLLDIFTVNIFLRLTVKILSFLRLTAKVLAVLRLTVNPIETLLQQFIIDPYIRKLKSCALKYRYVGEENFYLKRLGARQSL